jgi:transposase
MVNKKYKVHLTEEDRSFLQQFVSIGKRSAREYRRAMILLLSDKGKTDMEIHEILDVSTRSIERTRERYTTDNLDSTLHELPRPGQPKKLSYSQEQQIIAIACSTAPEGRNHWTLELLRAETINRGIVDEISKEPIRILLKRHNLKPWKKKDVVHSRTYQ